MTKYLLGFLIAFKVVSTLAAEELKSNDFEAELQLLEHKEMIQEEKAELLVEKMSAQNNSERDNDLVLDTVSSKNSAISKIPDKLVPNTQESNTNKKIRRIPSR